MHTSSHDDVSLECGLTCENVELNTFMHHDKCPGQSSFDPPMCRGRRTLMMMKACTYSLGKFANDRYWPVADGGNATTYSETPLTRCRLCWPGGLLSWGRRSDGS